jgi:hypothetical protein
MVSNNAVPAFHDNLPRVSPSRIRQPTLWRDASIEAEEEEAGKEIAKMNKNKLIMRRDDREPAMQRLEVH